MFKKHFDPALPPVPSLMVDLVRSEAYIKLRVPDWRSVERARYATQGCIVLYGATAVGLTWLFLPPTPDWTTRVLSTGLVSAVSIAVSAPLMRSILPDFLSRQVFARRLKIAFTPDWVAFKSWYYSNGVRIDRRTNGRLLKIQPIVEDDVEAKVHSESLPAKKHDERSESRRHLSQASCLTLMLRSGSEPGDIDQISGGRRFRTVPVAGMEKKIAERLVILIDTAMEMTARDQAQKSNDLRGRDLDLRTG